MTWGNRRQTGENSATRELYAAAAVAAGQLPPLWLALWIAEQSGDNYGRGINSMGIACVLVFAPLVLPVIGLVQALIQTVPAGHLAGFLAARARGPRLAWHLVCAVLLGVGWAALAALPWYGPSFSAAALYFGGLGILPVLAVGYVRRRPGWGFWGIWFRSGLASCAVSVLVVAAGLAATFGGLIKEYEPPHLTAAQVTGLWQGADGAQLRLAADGGARLTALPTDPGADAGADPESRRDYVVCEGTGTWDLERQTWNGRDGVALSLDGACGANTFWVIGGSERDPELFVLFGDPDAGELRILERQRPS